MIDVIAIRLRWDTVGSRLDERGRRLFAAAEVRSAGRGGLAVVSKITGFARSTINRGEKELDAPPLPMFRHSLGWPLADSYTSLHIARANSSIEPRSFMTPSPLKALPGGAGIAELFG